MVHSTSSPLLDQEELLGMEREGLVSPTFRRLDPARQESVVTAVLEEATRRGPTRVRLKETAEAAGVSVGSLYQYFGNRQRVIAFTVTLVSRRVSRELRDYIPQLATMPLAEGLRAWLLGRIEWTQQNVAVMQFYASAAYEGDPALFESLVSPIAEVMLEGVRVMLTAGRDRGEVRAAVDLEAAARVVHAMVLAVSDGMLLRHLNAYFLVRGPHLPAERTLEAALDLVVAGLRP